MAIRRYIFLGVLFIFQLSLLDSRFPILDSQFNSASAQTMPVQTWDSIVVSRLKAVTAEYSESQYYTGVCVYDLTDDTLLFGSNHHKLMRPASVQKLVTSIAALDQLGPDHPFKTSASISGILQRDSLGQCTLRGRIVIRGSMDPLVRQSDLQCIIDTLRSLSVISIEGQILADRSMKHDSALLGSGWCWDDDNPQLDPMLNLSVDDFVKSLKKAGIRYTETSQFSNLPKIADFPCATHSVNQVLQRMLKNSDNQHAESMLCLLGTISEGRNTHSSRMAQVRKTLSKTNADWGKASLADGSGLSLYNYITPNMIVSLLRYAYLTRPIFDVLYPSLPIAGCDGTLSSRMQSSSAYQNVHAKTGTLNHVSSLAGYLTAPTGHLIAFAIISNGAPSNSQAHILQDRLCRIMTDGGM